MQKHTASCFIFHLCSEDAPMFWLLKQPECSTEAPGTECHTSLCLTFPITWLYLAMVQILQQPAEKQSGKTSLWNYFLKGLQWLYKETGHQSVPPMGSKAILFKCHMPKMGIHKIYSENGTKPQSTTKTFSCTKWKYISPQLYISNKDLERNLRSKHIEEFSPFPTTLISIKIIVRVIVSFSSFLLHGEHTYKNTTIKDHYRMCSIICPCLKNQTTCEW